MEGESESEKARERESATQCERQREKVDGKDRKYVYGRERNGERDGGSER